MLIYRKQYQRQLVINGNSMSNRGEDNGGTVPYTYTLARLIRAGLTGTKPPIWSVAESGRTTTQLIANFSTTIQPYVRIGDVLVIWELTNDLVVNSLTAVQAYNNLVTYCNQATAAGLVVIVLTMPARDRTSPLDPADIETRRLAVNTLIRDNYATFCDDIVDVGLLPEFDSQADCGNTTYYNDRLHFKLAGTQLVADACVPVLQPYF